MKLGNACRALVPLGMLVGLFLAPVAAAGSDGGCVPAEELVGVDTKNQLVQGLQAGILGTDAVTDNVDTKNQLVQGVQDGAVEAIVSVQIKCPGGGGGGGPNVAGVDASASLELKCSGTLTKITTTAGGRASLVELGPFRLLTVGIHYSKETIKWHYACESKHTITAYGFGGLWRNVRLALDRDGDGVYHTEGICEYTGLPGDTFCTASKTTPVYVKEGEGDGETPVDGTYPQSVEACAGAWIRGINEFAPLSGTSLDAVVDLVDHQCVTATITWTWADGDSTGGSATDILCVVSHNLCDGVNV